MGDQPKSSTHICNGQSKCYTFLTVARGDRATKSREEGTGLKYIKARLTESYQDKWDLTSEPVKAGWKNTLTIYI